MTCNSSAVLMAKMNLESSPPIIHEERTEAFQKLDSYSKLVGTNGRYKGLQIALTLVFFKGACGT